jgi:hypothetical protein
MLCYFSKIEDIYGLNATFFSFFWFLISLVFYMKINIKKIQIYLSKYNTCTLIINYISKSCSSLSKKDLKVAKFRLRCTPCHFFKKCPDFKSDFYWPPAISIHRYTLCLSNLLFIRISVNVASNCLDKFKINYCIY